VFSQTQRGRDAVARDVRQRCSDMDNTTPLFSLPDICDMNNLATSPFIAEADRGIFPGRQSELDQLQQALEQA
jgi:hypothetical protein